MTLTFSWVYLAGLCLFSLSQRRSAEAQSVTATLSLSHTTNETLGFGGGNSSSSSTGGDPLLGDGSSLSSNNNKGRLTRTVSESLIFTGAQLHWLGEGGEEDRPYPSNYIPTINDEDLHTSNFTFTARVYYDFLKTEMFWVQENDPYSLLNFTIKDSTSFHNRGILGRKQSGFIINRAGFTYNQTHFTLVLQQDDFLQVESDELLQIELLPRFMLSGLAPVNPLFILVKGKTYPRDDLLVSFVSITNFLASTATFLLGVPGSIEVQATVMLGRMSCVDREAATFTDGTETLIAPTPFFSDPHGRLAGNMFLCAYFFLLHSLVCFVVKKQIVPEFPTKEVRRRLLYPSLSFGALVLLYPGAIYYAIRSVYVIVTGPVTLVIFFGFLGSLAGTYGLIRYVVSHKYFLERRFINSTLAKMLAQNAQGNNRPTGGGSGERTEEESSRKKDRGFSCAENLSVTQPTGRWQPFHTLQMYRAVIGEIDSSATYYIYVPFFQATVIAVATAIDPKSRNQCYGQSTGLAAFFSISAVLYLWKRPYRYLLQNVFSALSNLCLVVLTVASAINNDMTTTLYRVGLFSQFGFTLIRFLYSIFTVKDEWELSSKDGGLIAPPPAAKVRSDGGARGSGGEAGSDSGSGEDDSASGSGSPSNSEDSDASGRTWENEELVSIGTSSSDSL